MKIRSYMTAATISIALAAMARQKGLPVWQPSEEWLKGSRPYLRPVNGFVTKKDTAIKIGRAAILDRYDEELLQELEPLDAKRFGDEWVVYSHLTLHDREGHPTLGGVTTVEISASTGAILNLVRTM